MKKADPVHTTAAADPAAPWAPDRQARPARTSRPNVRRINSAQSTENVAHAVAEAERLGLTDRVQFRVGDAERLPCDDASVDALMCECAFCTFPDKHAAAREFARVLKPGGRIGLSDVTRGPGLPGEVADLMAWVACLADARPADGYAGLLRAAGFTDVAVEDHNSVLLDMIRSIGSRLFAVDILRGLRKIDLEGIDLDAAKHLVSQALVAVSEHRLGYAIVWGTKPELEAISVLKA